MILLRARKARNVFISYSREGGQAHAVNFYRGLELVLGTQHVFLDVATDAIEAGRPWKEAVLKAINACDTLLLVFDPSMGARLAQPQNAVRFEVEAAVARGVTVVCVRVNGAILPSSAELPPLLAQLPEWHSPQVHSDAAIADIDRIILELTGLGPGQVPWVDGWDLSVLAGLGLLGLVAWLTAARSLLNVTETWLWALALVLPWLAWMAGRRLLSSAGRGRRGLRYLHAAAWSALLIVLGGGWKLGYGRLYTPPMFSGAGGILVARFVGDADDRAQGELVKRFRRDEIVVKDHVDLVARLPRRIGYSWSRLAPTEDGHQEARASGITSQAAVVLWGQLQAAAAASPAQRLTLNLTFIESKALVNTFGAEVAGTIDRGELNGLDSDLARLADTLPRLLNGYRKYHSALTHLDFSAAELEFQTAIASLQGRNLTDARDRRVLDEILASLHFYRANTLAILGRTDEAVRAYGAAIAQTARDEIGVKAPQYIEAASNQGWLLTRQHRLDEAFTILEAVSSTCKRPEKPQRACAWVWYNLGDLLSDRGEHAQAEAFFSRAFRLIQAIPKPDVEELRLAAHAYQNRAYSLVRQSENLDAGASAKLLQDAEAMWTRGVETLSQAGLDVPTYVHLTRARIHIERREWKQAIDMLLPLQQVPADRAAIRHALLAGASACISSTQPQVDEHLKALIRAVGLARATGGSRITIQDGMKMVLRIKSMCMKNP